MVPDTANVAIIPWLVNIWIIIQWAASLDIIMETMNLLATAGFGINWNIFQFYTLVQHLISLFSFFYCLRLD